MIVVLYSLFGIGGPAMNRGMVALVGIAGLLGACSGAGTATAALRAVQDEAGSKLPVLGYTVPYAIGNILLTAWGPVIVMLTR